MIGCTCCERRGDRKRDLSFEIFSQDLKCSNRCGLFKPCDSALRVKIVTLTDRISQFDAPIVPKRIRGRIRYGVCPCMSMNLS